MSQQGLCDVEAAVPQMPTKFDTDDGNNAIPVANTLELFSLTVANSTYATPLFSTSSGNTVTYNVKVGAAITGAPADVNDAGLVSFDDTQFTVDEFGFVQLVGGEAAIDEVLTANATPQFVQVGSTATVDFGLSNLALGSSLPNINVGTGNVAFGHHSLESVTNGAGNTAIGLESSDSITTGSNNVAIGKQSLVTSTTSNQNTAVGTSSLLALTTSTGSNTAIGYASLDSITTGVSNTALGEGSGGDLTTSDSSNICIKNAGVSGDNNTIRIGTQGNGAGQQDTTFIAGIVGVTVTGNFVKVDSLGQLGEVSSGAIGQTITGNSGGPLSPTAGNWNIVTDNSTVVFSGAGSTLTLDFGIDNLMLGNDGSTITTGTGNTVFGQTAGDSITSGNNNTLIGENAGTAITTGSSNTIVGVNAGDATTSSTDSTFIGVASGGAINGPDNTFLGGDSGAIMTTGGQNVIIGRRAAVSLTTGNSNVIIGREAASAYSAESNQCIIIGANVVGVNGEDNVTRIGASQNACYIDGIDGYCFCH